jgi:hypothetical protein
MTKTKKKPLQVVNLLPLLVVKQKAKKKPKQAPMPPPKPPAGVPATLSTKANSGKVKKIKGFAFMKLTNPKRLQKISVAAGARAQKLYGSKIRWNKKVAARMASRGGLARWGRLVAKKDDSAA